MESGGIPDKQNSESIFFTKFEKNVILLLMQESVKK